MYLSQQLTWAQNLLAHMLVYRPMARINGYKQRHRVTLLQNQHGHYYYYYYLTDAEYLEQQFFLLEDKWWKQKKKNEIIIIGPSYWSSEPTLCVSSFSDVLCTERAHVSHLQSFAEDEDNLTLGPLHRLRLLPT